MNYTDLITIAIPVFERSNYFDDAFLSAVNQTLKCPVIVIDNHSSHDYFKDYVENYNRHNEHKVTYIRNSTNLGMTGNWNECIDHTVTQYLTILHDDDLLHQNYIEIVCDQIEKGYQYLSTNVIIGKFVPEEFNLSIELSNKFRKFKSVHFLFGNLSPFPGIVFPVEKAKEIGYFNDLLFPSADYDFWIRLSKRCQCYKTNTPLAFYRIHEIQETQKSYMNIINITFKIRKKLSAFHWIKYFSLYNLYNLYKFYDRSFNIKIPKENLDPELYRIFNQFSYFESKYVLKSLIKTLNKSVEKVIFFNLK